MSIFKVARSFNKFLKEANRQATDQLKTLRNAARDLYLSKDYWYNAAGPYEEDKAKKALEDINKVSLQYLTNAAQYGLSASQAATYYNQLTEAVKQLESVPMANKLDQGASGKLAAVKSALSSMVPVSIEASKPIVVPESVITPQETIEVPETIITPGDDGEGNAEEQNPWDPSSPDYYLKQK